MLLVIRLVMSNHCPILTATVGTGAATVGTDAGTANEDDDGEDDLDLMP